MAVRENEQRGRGAVRRRPIRDHSLERGFARRSKGQRFERKRSSRPTLPDLLAAHFRLRMPPRLPGQ